MRMTPERLAWIRQHNALQAERNILTSGTLEVRELLAEVDALRLDLAEQFDAFEDLYGTADEGYHRAEAAEARVAKLGAALTRIARSRCSLIRSGLDRDCVEDGKVSMRGSLPEEERERRKCPVCIARAVLEEKP